MQYAVVQARGNDALIAVEADEEGVFAVSKPTLAAALAEIPVIHPDDAMHAAIGLLERCTLTQLHAIEIHHLRQVKQTVANRTVERCKVHATTCGDADEAALVTPTAIVPPEAGDVLAGDDDSDEPPDADATDTVTVDPIDRE